MTPSETLRAAHATDWEAIATHPFTWALAEGSLPPGKMAWYLVQDYAFIDGFVRLAASAIAKAPTLADAVPLAQFLAVITGPENTYFLRAFDALGVAPEDRVAPTLVPETRAFQALMAAAAVSGSYARMMAVLTVAEWSYLSWAAPLDPPRADLPFQFAEWITLHAGPDFELVVAHLRVQLDAAWEGLGGDARATVRRDFAEAVRLERAFFDAAWQAGGAVGQGE